MTGLRLAVWVSPDTGGVHITATDPTTGDSLDLNLVEVAEARRFGIALLAALPPMDDAGGRYCCACRYSEPSLGSGAFYWCRHPSNANVTDPVTGEPLRQMAEYRRAKRAPCGPEGKLWEPR